MIARHRSPSSVAAIALALAAAGATSLVVGCSKEDKGAGGGVAAPSASAAAATAPSAVARPAPPTCVVEAEKVWAANASAAAGISQTELEGGRVAFGVVLGATPEVFVFDSKGEGEAKHVGVKKALSEAIPKGVGRREIHRVTPAAGAGGEVVAFVDYDQIGSAHRTVACGPSDGTTELLKFDGKPLLSVPEDQIAPEKAPAARPPAAASAPQAVAPAASATAARAASASPAPSSPSGAARPAPQAPADGRRSVLRALDPARVAQKRQQAALAPAPARVAAADTAARAAPSAAPPVPKKPAALASSPKGDKVRELRDCRTFVDRGGAHPWSAGSELVGQPQDDGSTEWSMELFAEQELGRGRVTLSTMPLGKTPTKLPVYESPVVLDLGAGEFSLATRARGTLFAWLLDASKHARGPMRTFAGMAPGAPRFASFGVDRALLVATRDASDRVIPRSLGFDPASTQLPATLTDLALGGLPITGPLSGAILGMQRFIAVQSDETARRLTVLSVDATLSSLGAPILVDAGVLESRLVPVSDGRLLVVYLRTGTAGRVELLSRTVKCG